MPSRPLKVARVADGRRVTVRTMNVAVYKLSNGRVGSTLAGKPGILVRTVGAKSGQRHTVCLPYVRDGADRILVASYGGGPTNPAWYYNLKANPKCQVEWKGASREYIAREAAGEEYEKYWQIAISYYKGYELYKIRAAHRHIPVMILVPEK